MDGMKHEMLSVVNMCYQTFPTVTNKLKSYKNV